MASIVQSVAFSREEWSVQQAKSWLKAHGYKAPRVDKTANFLRFRQLPPGGFDKYATKAIDHQGKPIELILGITMRANPAPRAPSAKELERLELSTRRKPGRFEVKRGARERFRRESEEVTSTWGAQEAIFGGQPEPVVEVELAESGRDASTYKAQAPELALRELASIPGARRVAPFTASRKGRRAPVYQEQARLFNPAEQLAFFDAPSEPARHPGVLRERGETWGERFGGLAAPQKGQKGYAPARAKLRELAAEVLMAADRSWEDPEYGLEVLCSMNWGYSDRNWFWNTGLNSAAEERCAGWMPFGSSFPDEWERSPEEEDHLNRIRWFNVWPEDVEPWGEGSPDDVASYLARFASPAAAGALQGAGLTNERAAALHAIAAQRRNGLISDPLAVELVASAIDPAPGRQRLIPISVREAQEFIATHHSQLPGGVQNIIFALGLEDEGGRLGAVATAGTPSAPWKRVDQRNVLELSRIASDATIKGASSQLASRMIDLAPLARRGDPQGDWLFVTYSFMGEPGTPYRALREKPQPPKRLRKKGADWGLRATGISKGKKARTGSRKTGGAGSELDKIVWEAGPAARPEAKPGELVGPEVEQARLFNPNADLEFFGPRDQEGGLWLLSFKSPSASSQETKVYHNVIEELGFGGPFRLWKQVPQFEALRRAGLTDAPSAREMRAPQTFRRLTEAMEAGERAAGGYRPAKGRGKGPPSWEEMRPPFAAQTRLFNPSGYFASGKPQQLELPGAEGFSPLLVEIRPKVGKSRPRLLIPAEAADPLFAAVEEAKEEWKGSEPGAPSGPESILPLSPVQRGGGREWHVWEDERNDPKVEARSDLWRGAIVKRSRGPARGVLIYFHRVDGEDRAWIAWKHPKKGSWDQHVALSALQLADPLDDQPVEEMNEAQIRKAIFRTHKMVRFTERNIKKIKFAMESAEQLYGKGGSVPGLLSAEELQREQERRHAELKEEEDYRREFSDQVKAYQDALARHLGQPQLPPLADLGWKSPHLERMQEGELAPLLEDLRAAFHQEEATDKQNELAAAFAGVKFEMEQRGLPVAGPLVPPLPPFDQGQVAPTPQDSGPVEAFSLGLSGVKGQKLQALGLMLPNPIRVFRPGTKPGECPQAAWAHYWIVQATALHASHLPFSFAEDPAYPKGIQERDYSRDKAEQTKVIEQARCLEPSYLVNDNPDAVNGPPIAVRVEQGRRRQ